ncbi:aflatoxin B1 aldehyde reductase member 3-like [Dendronephthya gigantea]|uniref:aflatoxin B1 aldehyde reductase member 3-like n=1 Tax=Dendronephthya gigantea TaxID=151771 RepID=UPI00106B17AB|nr:aflatoxin B1 aldehyde reductase member 3-like [Dendronephthya gigantea]
MVDTQIGAMVFGRQTNESESFEVMDYCLNKGFKWFDTALMYNGGKSEKIIGKYIAKEGRSKMCIATKAYPGYSEKGFSFDGIVDQLNQSLNQLQTEYVDIFYLHHPDRNFSIEKTLQACDHLHKQGKFKELGISNYAAWELAEIYFICKQNNWVLPTVYQGMYNPLTRMVEAELFPCMRRLGVRFFAYNMLAGGLLTGKHKMDDHPEDETKVGRFFGKALWPSNYRKRFWNKEYFEGVADIQKSLTSCYGEGKVSLIEASNRWMYHHSMLSQECGDGVILGGSSLSQMENNMKFLNKGPLDTSVVSAFDRSWERVRGVCPRYNR